MQNNAYLNQSGKLLWHFILFRLKQGIDVHGVKGACIVRAVTIPFIPPSGMPMPKGEVEGAAELP